MNEIRFSVNDEEMTILEQVRDFLSEDDIPSMIKHIFFETIENDGILAIIKYEEQERNGTLEFISSEEVHRMIREENLTEDS